MKIGAIGKNIIESLLLKFDIIPVPIADVFPAIILSQSVMIATRLGIFEALAQEPRTHSQLASELSLYPIPLNKLLNALIASGYLVKSHNVYELTRLSRKWMLAKAPTSMRDFVLFNEVQWNWLPRFETYLKTNTAINVHEEMSEDEWYLYQRSMKAVAKASATEIAIRIPVPRGATLMLDLGGSHGYYSVAICRRHPNLHSEVLDLPSAIQYAAPLLAEEKMEEQIRHVVGDATKDEFGYEKYDIIYSANLLHHFDEQTTLEVLTKIHNALKPGGYCVIQEGIRPEKISPSEQLAIFGDLYFALTSESGLWSSQDIKAFLRKSHFSEYKTIKLLTAPNQGLYVSIKPI